MAKPKLTDQPEPALGEFPQPGTIGLWNLGLEAASETTVGRGVFWTGGRDQKTSALDDAHGAEPRDLFRESSFRHDVHNHIHIFVGGGLLFGQSAAAGGAGNHAATG